MNNVLNLPINKLGRDIVVGDLHGSFALLKQELIAINFDKQVDRLICCGDLVDYGKNSIRSLDWIKQPWVYSVFGNHDVQYAFHDKEHLFYKSLICLPLNTWIYDRNPIDCEKLFNEISKQFLKYLYPAITINTDVGLVGVIHAEIPVGSTWLSACEKLNNLDYNFFWECIWNRDISDLIKNNKITDSSSYNIPDVTHVFHGHSYNKAIGYDPFSVGNRYYIDTGAYRSENQFKYPGAKLTLFDARYPGAPINFEN